MPFGTSCSKNLPGSRGTSHNQHIAHPPQPSSLHRLDQRRIEVIANGLPLHQGAQLAVDTTLVSPLTASSQPRRRQGNFAGAALTDARRSKERTYPELLQAQRCKLVVLGIEVGGRFSQESTHFLGLLAAAKTRSVPPLLRSSATTAFVSRWSALLAAAAFRSFAASLLLEETATHSNLDADPPLLSDVLWQTPPVPAVSRLAP